MTENFDFNDYNQRFGGLARLYGVRGLENLLKARVLVVGIGGVGSWACECLARSGVGNITLLDLDDICITNVNRQLPAMDSTIGKLKIQVISERIKLINPQCQITLVEDFFTESTADQILENNYDYVIDAIDSVNNKSLLASKCFEKNIPLVITGGAAGKVDPSQIKVMDLGDSYNDSLLFQVRKKLRQEFQFPNGAKSTVVKRQKFNMTCVFSPEDTIFPTTDGGTCNTPEANMNLRLDCQSGIGSACHITASFGMIAAGHAINCITKH